MSSLPDKEFYKVSSASGSTEGAPKFDVYTTKPRKTSALTESSPAALQHYDDESRIASYRGRFPGTVCEKIYTRPLCPSPTETVPVVSNDQPHEHDAEQQVNRRVEEGYTNCCNIDCYRNFAFKVRNSIFIYVVQLLFSSLPVSAIVMGILFAENCPKGSHVPAFGAVVGTLGVIFMAVWIFVTYSYRRGTRFSNRETFLFGMLCFLIVFMTIVDAGLVFSLSPSFDLASADYCNETFYTYALCKEIATAVAVVLSVMLYLPGSQNIWCCHNCMARSPSNTPYDSL